MAMRTSVIQSQHSNHLPYPYLNHSYFSGAMYHVITTTYQFTGQFVLKGRVLQKHLSLFRVKEQEKN